MQEDGKNYGEFLLDTIEGSKDQFTEDEDVYKRQELLSAILFIWKMKTGRNIFGDLPLLSFVFRIFFQMRQVHFRNLDMNIVFQKRIIHGVIIIKLFISQIVN